MQKELPRVVIVGRVNVGKSTLFNRLSERVKGMVLDYAGVTRDFITDQVQWQGKRFELVDTGGVVLGKTDDPILTTVRERTWQIIKDAALTLLVCDGTVGVTLADDEIARALHKEKIPSILVINKSDSQTTAELMYEFEALGYPTVTVSAQHGHNIETLLEQIVAQLPARDAMTFPALADEEPRFNALLLGKPNVGKSSLLNLLLKEERAIVADEPGTTREAISGMVRFHRETLLLTDTPGVRRSRSVTSTIETLMVKSTLRALERADIVLLVIDAHDGRLSDQELKLAFYAFQEKNKALIILCNKQDLTSEKERHDLAASLDEYDYLIKKIEILSISCKTGKNVGKIIPLVNTIWERHSQTLPAEEVTALILDALGRKPLYHKTNLLQVYRVYQVASSPITLLLTVNHPAWFGESQLSFFDNLIRANFNLKSVPVRFVVRKKS